MTFAPEDHPGTNVRPFRPKGRPAGGGGVKRRGQGGALPPDDGRPVVKIVGAKLERVVDEAEAALIGSDRGLYQRSGRIVGVGEVKIITSGQSDSVAQLITERGDYALVEDLTAAATFKKFDAKSEDWKACGAPKDIAKTLKDRGTRLKLPVLMGIVNAPTIRPDGSLLEQPGYDPDTGLLNDPRGTIFPKIAEQPSFEDGKAALNLLEDLFSTIPFVADSDLAVAVSAILTACSRNAYPTAPMHAITAPAAGSGKSMIVDIATVVATGRLAAVMALGKKADETEKRLGGALMSGSPVLALDNCETGIGGDLLCQILTQTMVRIRVLCGSAILDLPTNILITATGNNLVLVGDMTRRTVMCRIDPKTEGPELRVFDTPNPVAVARERRGEIVAAALTVLRAYVVAGRPAQASPLGSFEGWSRTVRDALLWLRSADPVGSMEEARKSDPELAQLTGVLTQWREVVGFSRVTAHQVIEAAIRKKDWGEEGTFAHPEFRDALLAVGGIRGAIDGKRLGAWLGYKKDKVVGGFVLKKGPQEHGIGTWQLFENGRHDPAAEAG